MRYPLKAESIIDRMRLRLHSKPKLIILLLLRQWDGVVHCGGVLYPTGHVGEDRARD